MRELAISGGLVALVDDEDYERVAALPWRRHGGAGGWVFAATGQSPDVVLMHRFIMRPKSAERVGHRDKNGLNNQKENLRLASRQQSMRAHKKHQNNQSGFKGVYWQEYGEGGRLRVRPWCMQIVISGKKIRRYFFHPDEAAQAYDEFAKRYFGEFAVLNFPEKVAA